MGVRKLVFPIALAIVWVILAALAMVDFASFTASTQPAQAAAQGARKGVGLVGTAGLRVAVR